VSEVVQVKNIFLVGNSIALRPLEESDLEGGYISWLNDEEVCRYNSHHIFPYTRESGRAYIASLQDNPAALVLAIIERDSNEHIGNISLQGIDYVSRSAEFAILLGEKRFWGKGFSKEAAFLLLKHGFLELGLQRVYCGTSERNLPMQRLAVYLGMVEEGRRRRALFKHGIYHDIVEYGVLKAEFVTKFNLGVKEQRE
jgi:ribosomal-protein-alanine N-acetyltransferase